MLLIQHVTDTVTIGTREYLTRHWYMNTAQQEHGYTGMEAHQRFYGQFATQAVRGHVSKFFTEKEWASLAACEDPHLNGVFELSTWDRCDVRFLVARLYTACVYKDAQAVGRIYWSPSDNICIVKEAVRILLNIQKENQA